MKDNGVGLVVYVAIENTIHVPAYSCFNGNHFPESIMKLGVIYEEALSQAVSCASLPLNTCAVTYFSKQLLYHS